MPAFKDWKSVLQSVMLDDYNVEQFYLIRVGEGDDETRTRFMNRRECILFIQAEMARVHKP